MSKIYSMPSSLTSSPGSDSASDPAGRLIVLVPDLEWEYVPAIHRIWELANTKRARVLLLSLCKDPRQELGLRRALVILCAMLQDGSIPVETNVEIGTNWVDVVKRNYETGDTIVCFAEKRAGLLYKPLSQILQSNLDVPVYVLAGLFSQKPKLNWLSHVIAWLGFTGIILGFCILQARLIQLPTNWFQNIALILSIIPEFWLILVWNNRFS